MVMQRNTKEGPMGAAAQYLEVNAPAQACYDYVVTLPFRLIGQLLGRRRGRRR